MSNQIMQVLKEDGALKLKKAEPKIDDATLLRMYRAMMVARIMDERGMKLQRQGRINFYIGSLGQEAAHVGFGAAMETEDWFFPHYRDLGVAAYRGATITEMVHQCFGSAKDNIKGRQMPNHFAFREQNFLSISSPLTTQVPQAVGAAYAAKLRGDKHVVGVSFGDGSTSEGDFHVGLNFAGVWKAPVVFLCQNNQWAISVPTSLQTASETFAQKAEAYGFEGIRVDGNDILAVYAATAKAVENARKGKGPTLIEAVTYRMGPHSSSDDPSRYVDDAELEAWKAKDPIVRFRAYLETKGLWDDKQETALIGEIVDEFQRAVKEAEAVGDPPVSDLGTDVFAEVPWHIEEQIDDLNRFWSEEA